MHRKALGRGLDALIPGAPGTFGAVAHALDEKSGGLQELPIAEIGPNPFQPRTRFDDEAIRELAASIKATGVLQPVLVRRGSDGFQLVAGERRLRAAGLAGLQRIPALVREVDDREMLAVALVENVQREDLNPIEEAKAYQALAEKTKLTHDQISQRVGKQRASISNALRLLALPPEVQDMVSRGTLSAGHARALLAIEPAGEQLAAARYIQVKGFSVRRTEAYVRRKLRRQHSRPKGARPHAMKEWEDKLQRRFSTHVLITPKGKGGKIEFEYYGQEDLERLLEAWGVL
jgi:ParB family chromosome partitioning protein